MATVFIPPQMRDLTDGRTEVRVDGANLRQVMTALDAAYPGFAARLVDNGKIIPGIAVSIDNVVTSLGLLAKVAPESEVRFLAAIAGG